MQSRIHQSSARRKWYLLLGGAGLACGAFAWQAGWAQEPIGWMYSHTQDEYEEGAHLGDVPEAENVFRSLADDRIRQYDELDRPRFAERTTNRGAQVNEERFSVFASTNDEDAHWAARQFGLAWDEFGRLADSFSSDHRNPDFAIGQLLIVIDDVPMRESDLPLQTLITQNGQTIVYLNVAEGEPTLEEQLPRLQQGAVEAMLHLAELDRKFPTWVQQGLAEYAAEKLQKTQATQMLAEEEEEEEGREAEDDIEQAVSDELHSSEEEYDEEADYDADDMTSPNLRKQPAFAGMNLAGGEYWRLQRVAPDKLQTPDEEEDPIPAESLAKVKFLLEGDDGKHAPAFLLGLRELAEEATDPLLASRQYLSKTQLIPIPEDTVVDELFEELEPDFEQWQADPKRGQPLADPAQISKKPDLHALQNEMEVILKLAQRVTMPKQTEFTVQPRVTEFGAGGQHVVQQVSMQQQAIGVEMLFQKLTDDSFEPWATIDADGQLLLWTDEDRLAELLDLDGNRYRSQWRDGHWVLATTTEDGMQIEAWLQENPEDTSRSLLKFVSTPPAVRAPMVNPAPVLPAN